MLAAKNLLMTPLAMPAHSSIGAATSGFKTTFSWTHTPATSENCVIVVQHVNSSGSVNAPTATGLTFSVVYTYTYYSGYYLYLHYAKFKQGQAAFTVSCDAPSGGYVAANSIGYRNVGAVIDPFSAAGGAGTTFNVTSFVTPGLTFYAAANGGSGTPSLTSPGVSRWSKAYAGGVNYPVIAGDEPGNTGTVAGAFTAASAGMGIVSCQLLPLAA